MKMVGQYITDHTNLALMSRGIKTRSASRRKLRRGASEGAGDCAGRRGIAYTHFTDGHKALASSGRLRRELCSHVERLCHLLVGHRRLSQHVARAVRHFVMMQTGDSVEIRVNPDVYNVKFDTMKTCQHIDRRSVSEEVE